MKIFGIGLSRTGTTSLAGALELLGLRIKNWPDDTRIWLEAADYDALVDVPVIPYYRHLDHKYPGAKFVLTVRDLDDWLDSCERAWMAFNLTYHEDAPRIFQLVYGSSQFNRERFRQVYEAHVASVKAHFHGRPGKLLVLDICGGDGFEKLCPFLELPVPSEPFPYLNNFRAACIDEPAAWAQRLDQLQHKVPELLSGGGTVLYIGASPQRFQMGQELHEAGYEITLLEVHPPYARHYDGHPWLKDVICGDVRDIREIAGDRTWDAAVWWHGPEHIPADDLSQTLVDLESVTNRVVVLGCPWGVNRQVADSNEYQEHRSTLYPEDLEVLGYKTGTLGEKDNSSTWCHILAWRSTAKASGDLIVYTAIFGDYDTLRPAAFADVPHICFTDRPQHREGWRDVLVFPKRGSGKLNALYYKTLAHYWFDAGITIWQDGSGLLLEHPRDVAGLLNGKDIASIVHPYRDCIYDEGEAVVGLGKGDRGTVDAQVALYRAEGYPEHAGLHATGLVVRRHTAKIQAFNEQWWSLCLACPRDQLSFDFLLWKHWLGISDIPSKVNNRDYIGSRYITFRGHNE